TFANYGEAREAGYEEGLIPVHNDFASVLKKHGLSEFVGDVRKFLVDFDLSEVRVLQEVQNKLWERGVNALNKGGITRKRFKEMVGEKADDKLDDVYYIPVALVVTPEKEDQTVIKPDEQTPGAPGVVPPPGGNPLTLPKAQPAPQGG